VLAVVHRISLLLGGLGLSLVGIEAGKAARDRGSSANLCECARRLRLTGISSSPLCVRSTTTAADRAMRQSFQSARSAAPRSRQSLPSWMSTTSASEIAALDRAECGSCRYRIVHAAKRSLLIVAASTLLRGLRRRQFRRCSTLRRESSAITRIFKRAENPTYQHA
jgi:hypothetical protein